MNGHPKQKNTPLKALSRLGLKGRPLVLAAFFAFSSLTSIAAALVPDTANAATPTTETSCLAAGGTWNSAYVGSTPPGCSLAYAYTLTPEEQAQSFAYYAALGTCVSSSAPNLSEGGGVDQGKRLHTDGAASGKWFSKPTQIPVFTANSYNYDARGLSYLDGINGIKYDAGSNSVSCAQTGLVTGALKIWKNWAPDEALCAMGFRRADDNEFNANRCTNASGGSDEFRRASDDSEVMAASFRKAVRDRMYGGKAPVLSDPVKYLLYFKTFQKVCVPTANVSFSAPTGSTTKDYAVRVVQPNGGVKETYYTGYSNKEQSAAAYVYEANFGIAANAEYIGDTCAKLVAAINGKNKDGFADAYSKLMSFDPTLTTPVSACAVGGASDTTSEPCDDSTATSCVIESIGWLVCGIMGAISGVVDGLYGLIQDILVVNPLQQTDKDGRPSAQYTTWQNVRNIANVLLVIGFIIIIFSQLTGVGVSNYGIKKLLPRIVIVAIAINLSYIFMAAAIDITNIFGVGIKTILDTTGADATLESVGFQQISDAYLTGATSIVVGGVVGAVVIGATGLSASALALLALPFILGALLAVLAAFATMFIRNALIIVLVIISPVAFAAYLLPNTQSLFDRWRKLLVSMLILFPMAALLFGGARLAAYIIISSGQTLSVLIALFVMAAPLGALPFLIRSSNSILSGINNKLQSAAKMARGATQRGLKPFVDKQKAQYKAGQRNFLGLRQRPGSRNLAQGFDQRRRSRAQETANADTNAEENWKTAGVAGTSGAGRRAQRALDTQKTLGTRKAANDAQIDERSKRRIATPGSIDAAYEAQSFDAQKGSAAADSVTKQRNFGRVQNNAISTSAAAGGMGLGTIDRQQFASDEGAKTNELQIRRGNMESGVAAVAVQEQKTAEDAINIVESTAKAVYAETRDEALATEAKVASSRNAAADRVEEQSYATRLQDDPGLAVRAGGIDPQGETLVVAQAIETQRKAYDSNVAAYGVRLRQAGTPDSVAGALGRPDQAGDGSLLGLAMDSSRTPEEREAAGRAVVATGNIDSIAPYQDYLATALANAAPDTPERDAVKSLQKAYGESVSSSPGKPMGLGAADIAQFKTGDYLPPNPTINRPVSLVDLSVSDIQTLNTVNDKGVSMDGWAAMDKSDIARVAELAERGLIEPERLTAMWESLNTALSDVRWHGRIKDREQDKLRALIQPDPVTGITRIPAPPGKSPTPRR